MNISLHPILFLLFFVVAHGQDIPVESIGIENIAPRIFQGQDTNETFYNLEFAWVAEIVFSNDKLCGGALIHPNFILTASYCLIPATLVLGQNVQFDIHFHRQKFNTSNEVALGTYNSSNIILNENYDISDKNHKNDIGLIFLPNVTYPNGTTGYPVLDPTTGLLINPMPLVKRGTTVDPVTCYTSGWSFIDLSNFPPNILQNIQIPFLCKSDEIARCVAAWAAKPDNITIDPSTMLCAGFYQNPYKGPCNSERGTPLTCTDANTNTPVGIGILILANDCNGQELYNNVPAIFTNIYKYLDFINAKIVETIGGPPPFPV